MAMAVIERGRVMDLEFELVMARTLPKGDLPGKVCQRDIGTVFAA
jgi:hypothetical protein